MLSSFSVPPGSGRGKVRARRRVGAAVALFGVFSLAFALVLAGTERSVERYLSTSDSGGCCGRPALPAAPRRRSKRVSAVRSIRSSPRSATIFLRSGACAPRRQRCAGCHSPAHGFGTASRSPSASRTTASWARPPRDAQPAPLPDGAQQRLLPEADVERTIPKRSGDPFRNTEGFAFPTRRNLRFPPRSDVPTFSRPRLTSLHRAGGDGGSQGSADPSTTAWGIRCRRRMRRGFATNRSATPSSRPQCGPGYRAAFAAVSPRVAQGTHHVRHDRPGHRGVRVHADVRGRARRPVQRAITER